MASRLFMGWRMVAVAFFVDFVAVGFFFYSYGVFFKAIAAEFGDSRLGVALGLTVTNLVGAIAAPLVGRALDRFPLRRVIGVGATSMAVWTNRHPLFSSSQHMSATRSLKISRMWFRDAPGSSKRRNGYIALEILIDEIGLGQSGRTRQQQG